MIENEFTHVMTFGAHRDNTVDDYNQPVTVGTVRTTPCFFDEPRREIITNKAGKEVRLVATAYCPKDTDIQEGDTVSKVVDQNGDTIHEKPMKVALIGRPTDNAGVHHIEVHITSALA